LLDQCVFEADGKDRGFAQVRDTEVIILILAGFQGVL
jgi:hypothetical protein